ncbi:hypothetical protein [Leptolyngbya sp. FACHB-261]|uniref:hypothetical protein n=1 Tax=Leptolyngbya sp. FACHB-261 TaxID=2692806 RepID=UPI0016849B59|nr:hypothetical protein [Leptolyngbya sp. FACHB-261]MBD2104720.1 hypothetical protein [Leptolyngbya sp. FACHB-261]
MELKERLLQLAENELAEYSTDARKMEKLRPKIVFQTNRNQQQQLKSELEAELTGGLNDLLEKQRQTVALPFWGIAGLGVLEGFVGFPAGWVAALAGVGAAFGIQWWGWKLQAQRLLLNALIDIEERAKAP